VNILLSSINNNFSLCTGCHFQTHTHHIDKRNACNDPSNYLLCEIAAMGATTSCRYICIFVSAERLSACSVQDVLANKQDVDLTGTVVYGAAWFFNYLCLRHVNDFPRNRLRMHNQLVFQSPQLHLPIPRRLLPTKVG